jgi:hypothetical protein
MKKVIFSYLFLVPAALFLGLAPFVPEPHLADKLRMLIGGTLRRPIDIFDLFWHSWPILLLGIRIGQDLGCRMRRREP